MITQKTYSKSELQAQAEAETRSLLPGMYLDKLIEVKAQQEMLSAVEAIVRPDAQKEAEFQGLSESMVGHGVKISIRKVPAVYDYEADAEYVYLSEQVKIAKAKLDERKKILDLAIASPVKVAFDESGATVAAPPLVKEEGKTVAISLPK